MPKAKRTIHIIDATGKAVGRLATQISVLLQGKHKPSFAPNVDDGDAVLVNNVSKVNFTGKKIDQKKYYHHSGYLGGMKITPMKTVFAENPEDVLVRAVKQMLPKNRLLVARLKRLTIKK